ncbi:Cellobiose dehydrogenase [Lachnellula subtilissima]|uniref:Cellobiose dehydrogenase n=1 Tax=Lachnellula subtilissima TaxID=602034 RepID=A0A8H8UB22_9HELO|nr:Cellobiose dehydrogenase [Lachnellula subtilissima]
MRSFFTSLALVAGTYAQSSAYTDANTGITFQRYLDTEGVSFGIAIPETPASDFIGQMVAPSNGSGYAGVSLASEMTKSLLVVAWPNNDSVMASLRETRSGYTSPGVYTASGLSMSPISNGTFVNSTHMAYTFLCSGCMGLTLSFAGNSTSITLGWALGTQSVTNPSSASTASFTYHDGGFGNFGLTLSSATSASYASWAAMATNGTGSGGSISNSTCTSTATNVTSTVSNSTYDYIVAGAGPAGIIVAERLAESGKSVLLLERGQASTYATGGRSAMAWNDTITQYDVPSMAYYLTTASDTSEYCTDVASMAGCILGGGTMVNAMMFVRPQEADFNDKWPTGWKFPDVKASADRLYERNPGTTLSSNDKQRYDQSAWDVLSPFFRSIGYREIDAIQSPNEKTRVFSHPPWDIQDGLRAGPVKSYLPLAKAMSNFNTISGVEVEDSTGARQIINVNPGGKVILASGSMSTPRILYNSGIGPTDQITTVANGCTGVKLPSQADWINLPVGKNLRDHPIFTMTFNTTANATSLLSTDFLSPNTSNIDLFAKGSGPLAQSGQRLNFWTSMNTTNGTRYFQGTCNSPAAGQVRIKLYLTHGATSSGVLGITSDGATEFTTNPWMNTDADKSAVITLIDSLLDAAKNSSSLIPSSTMSGASLVSNYITGDHFVGTAIMGASNDGTAVVDTDTKVFGTDNLFVVDASIHPDLPTGNTQAIIMVVAEHASSKILALGNSATNSSSIATAPKKSTCKATPTAGSRRQPKRRMTTFTSYGV